MQQQTPISSMSNPMLPNQLSNPQVRQNQSSTSSPIFSPLIPNIQVPISIGSTSSPSISQGSIAAPVVPQIARPLIATPIFPQSLTKTSVTTPVFPQLVTSSTATPLIPRPSVAAPIISQPSVAAPIIPRPSVAAPIIPQSTVAPIIAQPSVVEPIIPRPSVAAPIIPQPSVAPIIPQPSVAPIIAQPSVAAPIMPQQSVAAPIIPQSSVAPIITRPSVAAPVLPQNIPIRPSVATPVFPQSSVAPVLSQPFVSSVPATVFPTLQSQPLVATNILPPQPLTTPILAQSIGTPVLSSATPTLSQSTGNLMLSKSSQENISDVYQGDEVNVNQGKKTRRAKGGILKQFETTGVGIAVTDGSKLTSEPVINIVEETGYSFLLKIMDGWGATTEQVQQLANLRYSNGSNIIDINRKDIIMEIIGILNGHGFDYVIEFLNNASDPGYILWEQPAMDEGHKSVNRELAIYQTTDVGVKGVGRCRYCPSTELVYTTKMTRSGDEGMTIFVRCVMCQKQWRE